MGMRKGIARPAGAASASEARSVVVLSVMRLFGSCRPLAVVLLAGASLTGGCASWQRVNAGPEASTEREVTQMFDANTMFARLGRLVSNQDIPYVGSVAFIPGPGDSTVAIVALSLANRVFTFERSGNAFAARYHVEFEFTRPGAPPVVVGRDEPIRVGSFQETMRTDESVLLQQRVSLVPGNYQLTVRVRDLGNSQQGAAVQKVVAPVFGPATYTAPILAYRVRGRATRDDSLSIVLNPRGTVAYGGDTLLVYVEGNGYTRPADLPLQVRDEHDSLVKQLTVHFTGNGKVEGQVIRIAPDSAPLGQLEILIGPDNVVHGAGAPDKFVIAPGGDAIHRTNAVVSFSAAWVVTNFDDLLSLLRYFGEERRVTAMRHAKGADRVSMWQEFYHSTDPVPATPENEALDLYFSRLAAANQRFREAATPGWRSDRGEVFITLGEPDEIHDQSAQLQNAGRVIQWLYTDTRLVLYFQDISGFGRFQLTPQSRSDFERIRARVQHTGG
jgi:GWxTD domain-containing protein